MWAILQSHVLTRGTGANSGPHASSSRSRNNSSHTSAVITEGTDETSALVVRCANLGRLLTMKKQINSDPRYWNSRICASLPARGNNMSRLLLHIYEWCQCRLTRVYLATKRRKRNHAHYLKYPDYKRRVLAAHSFRGRCGRAACGVPSQWLRTRARAVLAGVVSGWACATEPVSSDTGRPS